MPVRLGFRVFHSGFARIKELKDKSGLPRRLSGDFISAVNHELSNVSTVIACDAEEKVASASFPETSLYSGLQRFGIQVVRQTRASENVELMRGQSLGTG